MSHLDVNLDGTATNAQRKCVHFHALILADWNSEERCDNCEH